MVVHVFEGVDGSGESEHDGRGGKWSATLSHALPSGKHSFTASATEKSGLGNAEGKSTTVPFEVNTEPPVVTLEQPSEISPVQSPSFSGTASESLPVTVEVFEGPTAEGKAVAKVVATVSAGRYKSIPIAATLATGKYTAIATEVSSLGNETGRSAPKSFEVDTEAPLVEITHPVTPSNNTEPSFSGTVKGPSGQTVTVFVHEGTGEGKIIRSLAAPLSKGVWHTGPTPALDTGNHSYTVVASVPSSIGTGTGVSAPATFVVDTEPPTVTLAHPVTPSKDAKPSFQGTTSDTTPVEVQIYAGTATTGAPVTTAIGTPTGGSWASPALPKALADGEYTALATQQSSIGNGQGTSEPVTFTIDTKPPTVTLTGPPSLSSNRKPGFSGAASDSEEPVIVRIYKGASATGEPLTVQGEVSEGEWNSAPLAEPLEFGQYTAVAEQKSSLGNEPGVSSPVTFAVADIPPGIRTEGSDGISRTYATLYGSVNPIGGSVSACAIEVGPTTAYGRSIGCGFISGELSFPPAATGFVPVFIRIYSLAPGTTYHYRVIATGEGGTASGADMTFTTLPPLPKVVQPKGGLGESEVKAFFAQELAPKGRGARIGTILKKGLYSQAIKAPEAGTATIGWYYQPPKAKHGKKAKPVLLASGRVTFSSASSKTLKIRLTTAGRKLLKSSKRLNITVRCTFVAPGAPAVPSSGTFRLSR